MRGIYQNITTRVAAICGRTRLIAPEAEEILRALAQGATLKAHRSLDGGKVHKLHPLQGDVLVIQSTVVRMLEKQGWVRSNMKFPAATYLLTEKGRQRASG